MSGVKKQRFLLFLSIVGKSDILFLDEFRNNLDMNFKFKILNFLKDYLSDKNKSCVLITHDIFVL